LFGAALIYSGSRRRSRVKDKGEGLAATGMLVFVRHLGL
jgi:hypothetical protein